jgi:hypothetical protein
MWLATGFVFRPGLAQQFAGRLTATVRAISGAENSLHPNKSSAASPVVPDLDGYKVLR